MKVILISIKQIIKGRSTSKKYEYESINKPWWIAIRIYIATWIIFEDQKEYLIWIEVSSNSIKLFWYEHLHLEKIKLRIKRFNFIYMLHYNKTSKDLLSQSNRNSSTYNITPINLIIPCFEFSIICLNDFRVRS